MHDVIVAAHSFSSGEIVRFLTRHGSDRIAGVIMLAPAAIPLLMKTGDNPIGLSIEAMQAVGSDLGEDFPSWAERNSAPYFAGWGSRGIIDATLAMMNETSHQAMLALAEFRARLTFAASLPGSTSCLEVHD